MFSYSFISFIYFIRLFYFILFLFFILFLLFYFFLLLSAVRRLIHLSRLFILYVYFVLFYFYFFIFLLLSAVRRPPSAVRHPPSGSSLYRVPNKTPFTARGPAKVLNGRTFYQRNWCANLIPCKSVRLDCSAFCSSKTSTIPHAESESVQVFVRSKFHLNPCKWF